jgi:hypothetical protein
LAKADFNTENTSEKKAAGLMKAPPENAQTPEKASVRK